MQIYQIRPVNARDSGGPDTIVPAARWSYGKILGESCLKLSKNSNQTIEVLFNDKSFALFKI